MSELFVAVVDAISKFFIFPHCLEFVYVSYSRISEADAAVAMAAVAVAAVTACCYRSVKMSEWKSQRKQRKAAKQSKKICAKYLIALIEFSNNTWHGEFKAYKKQSQTVHSTQTR